jgi:hypothetical protein
MPKTNQNIQDLVELEFKGKNADLVSNVADEIKDSNHHVDFDDIFKENKKRNLPSKVPKNTPSLYDIVRFYKNQGVVGEESLVTAITLAAANDMSFGVEGFSGSGKTFVVDKLMELLPKDWIYKVELSSKLAVFYDSKRINESKIIYIPELQKAMQDKNSPIIEVIKNLTEGKDATRIVTSADKKSGVEYSIKKGISIIYTLALENYFKKDEESSRRFMRLQTDSSKEHLDDIHSHKARGRCTINPDYNRMQRLQKTLTDHIGDISNMKEVKVLDPCADYFKEIIPKTQKSVGYVDHYYNLVDACVKFHYNEREHFEIDNAEYVVANVGDHFNVFSMYFKEFTKTLKDFADRMEDGQEKEETLKELDDIKEPDWAACFKKSYDILLTDITLESLRQDYPNLPESWSSRQVNKNTISTLDYKTGKPVVIADLSKTADCTALAHI